MWYAVFSQQIVLAPIGPSSVVQKQKMQDKCDSSINKRGKYTCDMT